MHHNFYGHSNFNSKNYSIANKTRELNTDTVKSYINNRSISFEQYFIFTVIWAVFIMYRTVSAEQCTISRGHSNIFRESCNIFRAHRAIFRGDRVISRRHRRVFGEQRVVFRGQREKFVMSERKSGEFDALRFLLLINLN